MESQLNLFSGDGTSKTIIAVPIDALEISDYNPRKNRTEADIQRLAERIARNGFEITRALWAYADGKIYKIFAGGNRFLAAKAANLKEIPIVLHEGFTDEQIVGLSDQDNENDEYHAPVPIVDMWASYKALEDLGWTQERIASAKGVSRTYVVYRLQMASFPVSMLENVTRHEMNERHCREFLELSPGDILSAWLTRETAMLEIIESVFGKTNAPTAKHFETEVKRYNALFELAEKYHNALPESWREKFIKAISTQKARSEAKLQSVYTEMLNLVKAEAAAKEAAMRAAQSEAEAERVRLEREHFLQAAILEKTAKIVKGDAREFISVAPYGIRLVLTDPPYGMDFQSNRRVVKEKTDKISGDDDISTATSLLENVLQGLYSRMLEDSFAMIWTSHKYEPQFRQSIENTGLIYRQTIVWVKNNHGSGDLEGSFAPRHECLIIAVKGNPKLTGARLDDVLFGEKFLNSGHPTEKPIDLLKSIIESVTNLGDIVVDPFAGSGSSIIAAMDSNRDFWACEIDDSYYTKITDLVLERTRKK